jgi:hypothetical protein
VVRFEDIVHSLWLVHYVFNPDQYIDIVIANTTLLYKYPALVLFEQTNCVTLVILLSLTEI